MRGGMQCNARRSSDLPWVGVYIRESNILQLIYLTECNSGTILKLPFEVNSTIQFKNVATTSHNTAHLLVETYPARCHYCRM
jgi:hypothetical protein